MADDPKKPYGDVEYADPKNGKYPIDTEAHVRAAWSYVNMPKNQKGYSSEELAQIKSRIKVAAKKFGIEISDDSANRSEQPTSMVETRSANVDNVDFGQRIITVIIAPYEQPTEVFYRQEIWNEVFSRSAWQGIETRQKRIPAIAALQIPDQNHNGHIVGRMIEADPNRTEGLVGDVKISRTDRGDETLELAADDALSVSAGFMVKDRRRDEVLDRRTKTRRINRAFLDHLAFVGQPAYPGARILAMRNDGNLAEAGLPRLVTPRLDEFMNDPIFQWAADRAK